jgi:hypothetical protein
MPNALGNLALGAFLDDGGGVGDDDDGETICMPARPRPPLVGVTNVPHASSDRRDAIKGGMDLTYVDSCASKDAGTTRMLPELDEMELRRVRGRRMTI